MSDFLDKEQISTIKTDICIIGAGAGGLSVAAGAAGLGARVVLIEQGEMGGDCLNTGCVPSKSLLAAAKAAQSCLTAKQYGIHVDTVNINFFEVMSYIKSVIETIATHDSEERFEKLGVTVIREKATFLDTKTVAAGAICIHAKKFVIATGSIPTVPPISGLDKINYFTNETIFSIKEKPEHLIVIGGGPIGCELSQAFSLLGVQVTLLEALSILPKDDQEFVDELRCALKTDGVNIDEHCEIIEIDQDNNVIKVKVKQNDEEKIIFGSHLLIATGRKANISELNLLAAKIDHTDRAIIVDHSLRTSNKNVFAIGDVTGHYQFTHLAGYHASIVIKNALFHLRAKINTTAIPWVTYTIPELSHAGLSEKDAIKQYRKIKVVKFPFKENDRAITDGKIAGGIKVITKKNGVILGVTLLGTHAGELLMPWIIAIAHRRKISEFLSVMTPYPTLSEINRQVASEFYKPIIFSKWMQSVVKFLSLFS